MIVVAEICPLLPRLPASRVASAVEAADYHNPMLLQLEEYAVWEAVYSGTATVPVDDWELQRTFSNRLNRAFDR